MRITTKIVLSVAALLTLPVFGMAAERSITASSLNNAYNAQVSALDLQIANDQEDLKNQPVYQGEYATKEGSSDADAIAQAKRDKQQLELTYKLLEAALQ